MVDKAQLKVRMGNQNLYAKIAGDFWCKVSREPVGESLSPAGSVRVGSSCHRQEFNTDPFDSLHLSKKIKTAQGGLYFFGGGDP